MFSSFCREAVIVEIFITKIQSKDHEVDRESNQLVYLYDQFGKMSLDLRALSSKHLGEFSSRQKNCFGSCI